jgi:phenylpropionate dioxygenase-like ring-hydroxylating dioxygenase large terminal subunit
MNRKEEKLVARGDETTAPISYDPAQVGYSVINEAPPLVDRHRKGEHYTSPAIYELEKEKIFYHDWLNIGRVEEIEKPGDFLTTRIADEPVIVVRTQDNQIVAMSNVCAHRGVEVAFGEGNQKFFTCPYHGWVYDLDGKLKDAQYLETSGFDTKNCRLPQLKVDTWGGFIFVTLNPNPKPLLEFLGDVPKMYEPYQLDRLRMAMKFPMELNVNWKLVNENLTDIYHIAVLHASTFGPYQPLSGYRFAVTDGGYHGRFTGGTLTPDGQSRFGGPMPWLPEALHSGGYSSHIPPNMAFFPRFDYVSYTTTWPIEVDKCVGWSYMLFPEEYFEQPDFMEKAQIYADFYQAFLSEDTDMILSLQKGLKSRYYGQGPMSPFEAGVRSTIKHAIDDVVS